MAFFYCALMKNDSLNSNTNGKLEIVYIEMKTSPYKINQIKCKLFPYIAPDA